MFRRLWKHNLNRCRQLRALLMQSAADRPPRLGWLERHLAQCPRCQRRMLGFSRTGLALTLMKSQPHDLDLLARANQQALGVLSRQTRGLPAARRLANARPQARLWLRLSMPLRWTGNAAACLTILVLGRFGVLSSMQSIQDQGQKTMHHLYAKNAGDDIANDIFA